MGQPNVAVGQPWQLRKGTQVPLSGPLYSRPVRKTFQKLFAQKKAKICVALRTTGILTFIPGGGRVLVVLEHVADEQPVQQQAEEQGEERHTEREAPLREPTASGRRFRRFVLFRLAHVVDSSIYRGCMVAPQPGQLGMVGTACPAGQTKCPEPASKDSRSRQRGQRM